MHITQCPGALELVMLDLLQVTGAAEVEEMRQ